MKKPKDVDAEKVRTPSKKKTVAPGANNESDGISKSAEQDSLEPHEQHLRAVASDLSEGLGDDEAITQLMLHCAAVLAFRRSERATVTPYAFNTLAPASRAAAPLGRCYRSVAGEDRVQIWANGFAVKTMPLDEARRLYPSCG
ncbi:hypothetical protein [Ancylobacter sp.]|uniref:hypothetical protein n=1 Tax=Ancylobacter sp. TaxID=1872567 RepID=UPI003D135E94